MSVLVDPFAPGVARVPVAIVNAYLLGDPAAVRGGAPWALVDTGVPGLGASVVPRAIEERFGEDARPAAIVLTHGHFDHAGSALALAEDWGVPIYAHPLELPYLTGRSDFAPGDPSMGGAIAQLSRTFPSSGYDFGARVHALPEDGTVPGAAGWTWLHTPGHTNGHVSLWREADRVLIAGDAVATMDMDSWAAQATKARCVSRSPVPFTPDWPAAVESARRLAALRPDVLAAGHGLPIVEDAARRLATYADYPNVPTYGRYAGTPARADETGIVWLPPPVPDRAAVPLTLGVGAAAAALTALTRRT